MPLILKRYRKCGAEFNPRQSRVKRGDYVCYKCAEAYHRTPESRAKHAERLRRYRTDPEKHPRFSATSKVKTALKSGRLVKQPCEVCGATEHVQAHHDDYAKPLDVRWLCREHHRLLHLMELRAKQAAEGADVVAAPL